MFGKDARIKQHARLATELDRILQQAPHHVGAFSSMNEQALLMAAGVTSFDDLPAPQASSLKWLAHWEPHTVACILAAIGKRRPRSGWWRT